MNNQALRLPDRPRIDATARARVQEDAARFAEDGLPRDLEAHLLDRHAIDVTGEYAGFPLKNPWGVASGQLSMKPGQVESALRDGIALVVLKTVIAEDATGDRSMEAWAVKESRMVVEPIVGKESGRTGWTVTWKGRGWWHSFEDYLELVREGATLATRHDALVVPSVKYHLPGQEGETWRVGEYVSTTTRILDAYRAGRGGTTPMPIEKDFSPTLAGSERSARRRMILEWLDRVPRLIRDAVDPGALRVGLKLFNSLEDDAFQLELLEQVHQANRPDFIIYANRLFDPDRVFEGHQGVAYGGPDLSDRNLRMLSAFRAGGTTASVGSGPLPLSGTGDIHSGRMAVEYALRGATSFQIHTLFQLPREEFMMKRGERTERALHRLYFDPEEGFVVWLRHAGERLGLVRDGVVRLGDVARMGQSREIVAGDLDA